MKKLFYILLILALTLLSFSCDKAKFTIVFDSNGGSLVSSQTVEESNVVAEPETPVKDGYDFMGWYLNGQEYDFSLPVTQNLSLTARWTETKNEFTVDFKLEDGSSIVKIKVLDGETVFPPEIDLPQGYEFVGWYNGDVLFDFQTRITQDLTLVGKIKKIEEVEFTITFKTDSEQADFYLTVSEGEVLSPPTAPQKYGFEFIGWYCGDVPFDFSAPITQNLTLVALWQEISVTVFSVIFYSEGKVVSSLTVTSGEILNIPEEPKKYGYDFDKWLVNGEPYDFNSPVQSNLVLVASWYKNEETIECFTVNYVDDNLLLHTETVASGSLLTPYEPAERFGFKFGGWLLNGNVFDFSTPVDCDLTLTAIWVKVEKVVFAVTFDLGNGKIYSTQNVEENGFAVEPLPPEIEGYSFVGWFCGENEFDFTTAITQDTVLTAKWVKTLSFDDIVGVWSGVEQSEYSVISVNLYINADKTGSISYGKFNETLKTYCILKLTYAQNILTVEYDFNGRTKTLELKIDGDVLSADYGLVGGNLNLTKN